MRYAILILALSVLSCSPGKMPNEAEPEMAEMLVDDWFRWTVLNKKDIQGGENFFDYISESMAPKYDFYSALQLREDGTWRFEIPEYAWAEGDYLIQKKRIIFTNPGCGADVLGTYVFVFRDDYQILDLQVEEDRCSRLGFLAGYWYRESV